MPAGAAQWPELQGPTWLPGGAGNLTKIFKECGVSLCVFYESMPFYARTLTP
jgi:hypothetical protein